MDSSKTPARKTNDPAANPDPITKSPGAHPVGTGIGAAAGGVAGIGGAVAAGAVIGSAGGPVGTGIGAVVGAVAGGLVGKGIAEHVNPSIEHEYWRQNYASRPYVTTGASYDEYGPAYQYGWESRAQNSDEDFDDIEVSLGKDWDKARGNSQLNWSRAKPAVRDAWDRIGADEE
jgi:phage tail tape-measure protein